MKLYTYAAAPNARRLHLFMDYKGIELETEEVDLRSRQQHCEPYASINPLRTIPALLLDDASLLTEVIAQVDYLESLYPEKPLLGRDALERAMILNWDHYLHLSGLVTVANIFRNTSSAFAGRAQTGSLELEQIPALAERGKLQLEDFWPRLETRLAQSEWVAGDNFSFADIDLCCVVEFAAWVEAGIPEDAGRLQAWHQRALDSM
ncbi:MAG: glutathione S-transferase family protein [Halieaceae bacterium]|nr:glutathione S-transferase family protein [Halieaceae bacterium]